MRIRTALLTAAFLPLLATGVFAGDADFKLVNKTGYQIDEVYVSQHGANRWGPDIMGRGALGNNELVNITFPHGNGVCQFDIKVKYNDGDTAEWGNINLCQYETISLFWDANAHSTRAVGE